MHSFAEHQAIGRSTEVEHPNLLSFGDTLILLDRDVASGDLRHADSKEGDKPYGGVVCLDEYDGPCSSSTDVALSGCFTSFVGSVASAEILEGGSE